MSSSQCDAWSMKWDVESTIMGEQSRQAQSTLNALGRRSRVRARVRTHGACGNLIADVYQDHDDDSVWSIGVRVETW